MSALRKEIGSLQRRSNRLKRTVFALLGAMILVGHCGSAGASVPVVFAGTIDACDVKVSRDDTQLTVVWPVDAAGRQGTVKLALDSSANLIRSVLLPSDAGEVAVFENSSPEFQLFVGQRRKNPNGNHTFFDKVDQREHVEIPLKLQIDAVKIVSSSNRASVQIQSLRGNGFTGELRFTFFAGTSLIHIEAIVSTEQPDRAVLFRGGLSTKAEHVRSIVYHRAGGLPQTIRPSLLVPFRPWKLHTIGKGQGFGQPDFDPERTPLIGRPEDGILQARYRAVALEAQSGSLAVFPAPHKFLYPLDFADNVGFNFAWKRLGRVEVGVRQPPLGDGRFRPWVDCPPGSRQHFDLFLLAAPVPAKELLEEVARFTQDERYPKLDGFKTFTSHYHMWHTRELIQQQQRTGTTDIPPTFERPLFVDKMKETGIDIAHLAEFHGGPRTGKPRYEELQVLHHECARLSDGEILILPGEEPNVHLGGHWVSFFPKPVYWDFVNRNTSAELKQRIKKGDVPSFQRQDPKLGVVYFVNSAEDVLKLFEQEDGLFWTAHPRIKGSTGYPDRYRDEAFFKSAQFFGGAWKAMPANYSHQRLGRRVLDLLDDMNQWGAEKQILGEADLFQLNRASELYGHANINYIKLDRVPRFEEGWSDVLDALRNRQYFTTTGEVFIPSFRLGGQEFRKEIRAADSSDVQLEAKVRSNFPLAFAEIVSGNGTDIFRERIQLDEVGTFSETVVRRRLDLRNRDWVRFEVWDVAENGAFTQPVLIRE